MIKIDSVNRVPQGAMQKCTQILTANVRVVIGLLTTIFGSSVVVNLKLVSKIIPTKCHVVVNVRIQGDLLL